MLKKLKFQILCRNRQRIRKQPLKSFDFRGCGPRCEIRTPDILLPNVAPYQLGYTRIFTFLP